VREGDEYRQYRARLIKPVVWLVPWRLWKKAVRVARWTLYEREWLIQEFGEEFWPMESRGGALSVRFEIQGRDSEREEWEAVSEWRRDQLRVADDVAAALAARTGGRVVVDGGSERGRRLGSGIDTLVRHLRDITKVRNYHELLEVLRICNVDWITETVSAWGDNAMERVRDAYSRGRKPHKEACEYCESGLPAGVEEAVARLKRR
jgi:hypothetical protein